MDEQLSKSRAKWLYSICAMIVAIIAFGGLVRLTQSGLSIVEWEVITGVVPPIGQEAWEAEFAKYQESPEYEKINADMSLDEYRFIYYMEYLHRLLARFIGLVFVLPLFYYLLTKKIAWRDSFPYLVIGLGLAFQGWLGWYMVASGLVDRPSVSHFRLAAHFVTAVTLLGITFWVALDNVYGKSRLKHLSSNRKLFGLALGVLLTYYLQITWGAFVAGLDAGWVSNTWPLMAGRVVPRGLLLSVEALLSNPTTTHFIHRWFGWIIFVLAVWLAFASRKSDAAPRLRQGNRFLIYFILIQISLGIFVVWYSVPISLASLHQVNAIGIYMSVLFVMHRLLGEAHLRKETETDVSERLGALAIEE